MTVMITGASGPIGRAAIPGLLARNPEVRAAVNKERDAQQLRALGAKVTVGGLHDASSLAAVLQGVHTLVHLVGGLAAQTDEGILESNHTSTMIALGAARSAGVRRFVLLSYPGASANATNPFLRAKGIAEEAVSHSGLGYAIVRSTHVIGAGALWFTCAVDAAAASPAFVFQPGTQEVAPVSVSDVAAIIAAVDDRRDLVEGTWAIEGPDVLTMRELSKSLGGDGPQILPPELAAARLSASVGIPIGPAAAEIFALPSRADAPDAAAEFGVKTKGLLESIREVGASLGLEG